MKQAIFTLLSIDILALIYCYFLGDRVCLMNIQIGFISSSLVMLGSMLSYQSMVSGRLNAGAVADDGRDTLDKLEDPYDLYDDEFKEDENKTLQEVVKEERKKLKKSRRTVWQTTKDAKASFSFYRLGAYLLLIVGFFYLNNNKILDIPYYLASMFLPPFVVVVMLMRHK